MTIASQEKTKAEILRAYIHEILDLYLLGSEPTTDIADPIAIRWRHGKLSHDHYRGCIAADGEELTLWILDGDFDACGNFFECFEEHADDDGELPPDIDRELCEAAVEGYMGEQWDAIQEAAERML